MEISAIIVGMLKDQAETAALAMAIQLDLVAPYLSQKQAHDKYGRRVVERWVKEGLVKPIKDGPANAKIRINRLEIDVVSKVSNRPSYFSLKDFR